MATSQPEMNIDVVRGLWLLVFSFSKPMRNFKYRIKREFTKVSFANEFF